MLDLFELKHTKRNFEIVQQQLFRDFEKYSEKHLHLSLSPVKFLGGTETYLGSCQRSMMELVNSEKNKRTPSYMFDGFLNAPLS